MKYLLIILVFIFMSSTISAQGKFFGGDGTGYSTTEILNQTLPLSDLNLIAQIQDNKIQLSWDQDQSQNTQSYILSKSLNNNAYFTIETIDVTNYNLEKFEYIDNNPVFGINYYTIEQIDINGNRYKSNISIVFSSNSEEIQILPNPFTSEINIYSRFNKESKHITIFSLDGKSVYEFNTNDNNINLSTLKNGSYYININGSISKIIKH